MPNLFNISIVKGEPFASTVTASLCTTGQFNLSGYNVSGGIKYHYSEPNLVDFGIDVNSQMSGILTMSLSATETAELPLGESIYYLKAFPSGDGSVIDLLNGYVLIYPL